LSGSVAEKPARSRAGDFARKKGRSGHRKNNPVHLQGITNPFLGDFSVP
jgi:hypothetical protein